jgi:putative DNA primase/helicase
VIEVLGAPVKAFIRDCCEVGPGKSVPVDKLFEAYKAFRVKEGCRDSGTREWFGRGLHSAVPGLRTTRPIVNGVQVRTYEGIGLKPEQPL